MVAYRSSNAAFSFYLNVEIGSQGGKVFAQMIRVGFRIGVYRL